MKTVAEIRAAFQKVHKRACGDTGSVYMSIPPRPEVDADLVVSAALDELETKRLEVERLDLLVQTYYEEHRDRVQDKLQDSDTFCACVICDEVAKRLKELGRPR